MAIGLGMTDAEWEELKGKVDDSFWVMRIIGLLGCAALSTFLTRRSGYPPLPNDDDGFSCGSHKLGCIHPFLHSRIDTYCALFSGTMGVSRTAFLSFSNPWASLLAG